jgi:hypothetical protein
MKRKKNLLCFSHLKNFNRHVLLTVEALYLEIKLGQYSCPKLNKKESLPGKAGLKNPLKYPGSHVCR